MSVHNLENIFRPDSVAVVGASQKMGSVGWGIIENLVEGPYPGRIYPINPRHQKLWGMRSAASISRLVEPVDLAVVAVPIDSVPDVIRQCAATGIGGAIIVSACRKEIGKKLNFRMQRIPDANEYQLNMDLSSNELIFNRLWTKN